MKLRKSSKKLQKLAGKIEEGKNRIAPDDVAQVLAKVTKKARKVEKQLAEARDAEERERLERKLAVIRDQQDRGEELLKLVEARRQA